MRPSPALTFELALHQVGFVCVAGLDEAGRGAWAGPVVAAAVVLPLEQADLAGALKGVRDSKQMSPQQRHVWDGRIRAVARAVATGTAQHQEVDEFGPLGATRLAMQRALEALSCSPDSLLIDHLRLPEVETPQTALPHGDAQVLSIAAASVIAKVSRDRMMIRLGRTYPGYGFEQHKGYGTKQHRRALDRLGPCPIHRLSYSPVAAVCPPSASDGRRDRRRRLKPVAA